jgi:hypothetical protein
MTDDYDFELADARKKARYEDDYGNDYKKDKSDEEGDVYDRFQARDFTSDGFLFETLFQH